MSYFGISNFSLINSGSTTRSDGNENLYSAISSYSQTRSIKSAVTALNSSALSAKNSKESAKVQDRLSTIAKSISGQSNALNTSMKTDNGSSRISDLAKEAGEKMYAATTGTGTKVNTTV